MNYIVCLLIGLSLFIKNTWAMEFYIVDVFAEQKYQGNPLAVFIPPKSLSSQEMQKISREINFSETTFIISDKGKNDGYDVRIFTPSTEVPFAGHPILGTAFIAQRYIENNQNNQITLNVGVGKIPVSFFGDENNELLMDQKQPVFGQHIDINMVAGILQIDPSDVDIRFPIQIVSTGLPAIIIPLKTRTAITKCSIHHAKYKALLDSGVQASLLVFTSETEKKENDLHVRVFVDDPGYFEDPATGSANGNLAAYLLQHKYFQTDKIQLRVEQGCEMGRPSLIKIKAKKNNNAFHIQVGGKVFFVAKGDWSIAEAN